MTREEAIIALKRIRKDWQFTYSYDCEVVEMAIKALESLDKLDEIIVEQIDVSNNQVECQTLRWVLDKMSEVGECR